MGETLQKPVHVLTNCPTIESWAAPSAAWLHVKQKPAPVKRESKGEFSPFNLLTQRHYLSAVKTEPCQTLSGAGKPTKRCAKGATERVRWSQSESKASRPFFGSGKMKYRLSRLVTASLGTHTTIKVQEVAQALDKDLEIDFLRGEIQFTRVNKGIYAQGRLQTRAHLSCVRCLEPFSYSFNFEITELYVFSRQYGIEEPIYLIEPDGTADITEPTRQQVWINLPLQPLCRPDCQGLCPQCGVNLNHESCACQEETVDPRFAMLKELLE